MSLFPGLFEAGASNPTVDETTFFSLLQTKYGLYAVALVAGAAVQTVAGSYINVLLKSKVIVLPLLSFLLVVSHGLESWGYFFKGYITVLAAPGILAGLMCLYLLISHSRNAAQPVR